MPQVATDCEHSVAEMKEALLATMQTWKPRIENTIKRGITAQEWNRDDHTQTRNALLSKKLHHGNLCNMNQLKQVIQRVARIDRLPDHNTIEATRTLCQAWDSVDLFTHQAGRSKLFAKISYALLLLIGAAASIVTTISLIQPALIDADLRDALVIALSIAGSTVAGFTEYMDPASMWMELQGAALSLESEIWKFRTRNRLW